MIVSYHPPIFKPLTSLTLSNPLQRSLLSCASAGISIYTPHTALDNVRGGINDWLAQGVLGYSAEEARERVKMPHPGVSVLGEIKGEGAGVGRLVTLRETPAVSIGSLAARLKAFLNLSHGRLLSVLWTQRYQKLSRLFGSSASGTSSGCVFGRPNRYGSYLRRVGRICNWRHPCRRLFYGGNAARKLVDSESTSRPSLTPRFLASSTRFLPLQPPVPM